MTDHLFSPFWAGIVLSAVLAAIMSTASAQLLVGASAVAQDLYKQFIHKDINPRELVLVTRLSVIGIALIAIALGLDPNNSILNIVAYAWAGFGATFGPALLFSLLASHYKKWYLSRYDCRRYHCSCLETNHFIRYRNCISNLTTL